MRRVVLTAVHGIGDAEGNLQSLDTLEGVDLIGQRRFIALSTDGDYVAYSDHADPAAVSHFWSPELVVSATFAFSHPSNFSVTHPVSQ